MKVNQWDKKATDCNDGDFLLIKILLHLWKRYIVIVLSTAPTAKAAVHLIQDPRQVEFSLAGAACWIYTG